MPGSNFNTFAVTEDYKSQNKWGGGQVPSILPFLSQLSGDDGADCISDISSLYNPKEDRQTESYGRRARIETGRLTREMDGRDDRHVQRWSDQSETKKIYTLKLLQKQF